MSSEIVLKAISELDKLEIQTIERKLCLEYHKILFSYLAVRLGCIEGNVSALIDDLYSKTDKALSELDGKSAFYISKLYLIKIYLACSKVLQRHIQLCHFQEGQPFLYKNYQLHKYQHRKRSSNFLLLTGRRDL